LRIASGAWFWWAGRGKKGGKGNLEGRPPLPFIGLGSHKSGLEDVSTNIGIERIGSQLSRGWPSRTGEDEPGIGRSKALALQTIRRKFPKGLNAV